MPSRFYGWTAAGGLAIAIPNLGLVMSLIGSVGSGLLALIFPPIIHYYVMREELSQAVKFKDAAVAIFGVIGKLNG